MPSLAFHPGCAGTNVRSNPWALPRNEFLICAADNFGVSGSGRVYIVNWDPCQPNIARQLVFTNCIATADCAFDACVSETAGPSIIVVACGDGVKMFDTNALDPAFSPRIHYGEFGGECSSVHWNQARQDTFLAASWDRTVRLFSPGSGRPVSVQQFAEHTREVHEVCWSPREASLFASVSADGSYKVWDTRSGRSVVSSMGHNGAQIMTVDWNKYHPTMLATGSVDGTLKIWDLRRPQQELLPLRGHQAAVKRIRFSPHSANQFLSGGYDFRVCLWDLDRAQQRQPPLTHRYEQHREFVCGCEWALATPGHVVSASWDGTMFAWPLGAPPVPTHMTQPPLPPVMPPPRPPGASRIRRRDGSMMPPIIPMAPGGHFPGM